MVRILSWRLLEQVRLLILDFQPPIRVWKEETSPDEIPAVPSSRTAQLPWECHPQVSVKLGNLQKGISMVQITAPSVQKHHLPNVMLPVVQSLWMLWSESFYSLLKEWSKPDDPIKIWSTQCVPKRYHTQDWPRELACGFYLPSIQHGAWICFVLFRLSFVFKCDSYL